MAKTNGHKVVMADGGNTAWKVVTSHPTFQGEDTFPHMFTRVSQDEFNRVSIRSVDKDYFVVNGTPYVIGEKAERKNRFERKYGESRYNRDYYGVMAAIAMTRIFQRSTDDIFWVGSHPPKDVSYAYDLLGAVEGEWEVHWNGCTYQFNVVDGFTIDEPMAGWANRTLRKDGKDFAQNGIKDGITLVLDIGGYTTDGIVIDVGGAIDYTTALSVEIGVLDAVQDFKEDWKSRNPDMMKGVKLTNDSVYHDAIRTGTMNLRGRGRYGCRDLADETAMALTNKIVSFYEERYGGGANYDYLVFTGGGGALLQDYLKKHIRHNDIRFADDDVKTLHMANARGGLKWAYMGFEAGIYE